MRRDRVISEAALAWTAGRIPAGGYFALVRRRGVVGARRRYVQRWRGRGRGGTTRLASEGGVTWPNCKTRL
jgi:hypothetical protein